MTQADIARALGLSPALMTKMKRQGCPMHSAEAVAAWRRQNVAGYARAGAPLPPPPPPPPPPPAAGPAEATAGTYLDLAQERALLAREQRLGIEMKNAVQRGEFASVTLLAEVLATASAAVVGHLEQLPGRIKRACPLLPARALEQVMQTVAAARNEWVRSTAELVVATMNADDDEDAAPTGEATAP